MVEREHFRVLGLRPGASPDELRSAYRTLAKKYHPDTRNGTPNALAFTRVVAAYQCIMQDRMTAAAHRDRHTHSRPASPPRPHSAAPPRPAASGASRAWRETRAASPVTDMFALGRLLLMSSDPAVRASAARELGRIGKSSAYAFLRKAFSDRDERVVCAAVRAVRDLAVRQSSGELASLYSRSGPAVRREILAVAAGVGASHGFENILRLAIEDPDPSIRAIAQGQGWSKAGASREGHATAQDQGWSKAGAYMNGSAPWGRQG